MQIFLMQYNTSTAQRCSQHTSAIQHKGRTYSVHGGIQ